MVVDPMSIVKKQAAWDTLTTTCTCWRPQWSPHFFQQNRRCLMQRRALGVVLACLFLFGWVLSACGSSTGSPGPSGGGTITLTVATNQVGNQSQVLQDIAQKFMKANPNIKVDF